MSVDADISASLDLLGKTVGDLQDGIEVHTARIDGTLNYLTDYTGFSGDEREQGGNYLCLHIAVPGAEAATITVQLIGGTSGPVTLDEDGIVIFRIKSTEQSISVRASMARYHSVTKVFALSGLTLLSITECGTRECGEW